MADLNSIVNLSDDPANARRHLAGQGGVKYATGHVSVTHQAPRGNSAPGAHSSEKIRARHPQRIGTWNVRGLNQDGKLQIVEKEMKRKDIQILGMSETKWRKSGHFVSEFGNKIYFSGPDDESNRGVAFIVPKHLDKCVIGYKAVSDRIITLKLNASPCRINVVQIYAPTAQATDDDIDLFYNMLSETIEELPKREVTLLLGDFNAKVGRTRDDLHLRHLVGRYGIGDRNERGERLLQFCSEQNLVITNTCFKHHIRRLYTWVSPGDRCRNQIDFIMIPRRWRSSITNATTLPGADCGSDHQLLVSTLKLRFKKLKRPARTPDCRRVDIKAFKQAIHNKIKELPHSEILDPNLSWTHLKEVIQDTAKDCVTPRGAMKEFITPETAKIILERRKLKESGLSTQEDQKRYSTLSADVQRRCRRDRTQHITKICEELERHAVKNETKDLFQKVKYLTRTRTIKNYAVKDEQGVLLAETLQVLDRWKRYCSSLYQSHVTDETPMRWNTEEQEPDILPSEIDLATKSLKLGKSPGKDGIPAELLKNLGPEGISIMTRICNLVWTTGQWPIDWTESIFIPLHKKGSTTDCGNFRTIALISHASKIILHVINKRLRSFLDRQIPEEQAGFVKGKGTREQILNIRQIIEKSREFNNPVVLCFIDYSKAFDSVTWSRLWMVLEDMGVPKHLINLIRNLYSHNNSFVKIDMECSDVFTTKKGVRQGCILSPLLFNIYSEHIIRKTIDNWEKGFPLGGKRICNLRYADDTVLVATSCEDMKELLQKLEAESIELGLSINRGKTKLMIVDRAGKLSTTNLIPSLEVVDNYIYLGSQICSDGSCVPEIKRRIAMAKNAMTQLTGIWKNRGISIKTKSRLVRALIIPIFMYGVETWTIRARERQRIDAFEMWCWRRMLRVPWTAKRTNVSILSQLGITARLSSICYQRLLSYFGHIMRRGNDSLERLIITGNTEGRRGRGRSPTRWSDQLRETSSCKFYTMAKMATDRGRWKQLIRSRLGSRQDHDLQQ